MENSRNTEFGSLLKSLRLDRKITLRRFAEMLDIAPSYLSDVENSRKGPFSPGLLKKAAEILRLTPEEQETFDDAVGKWSNNVAQDISTYMNSMPYARIAMRVAEKYNATDEDFIEFITKLQSKQ